MPWPTFEGTVAQQLYAGVFLGSKVIEPTYLAQGSAATFQHPDGEIDHFVKHA